MCPELGTLVLDTLNPDRVELISAVGTFNLKTIIGLFITVLFLNDHAGYQIKIKLSKLTKHLDKGILSISTIHEFPALYIFKKSDSQLKIHKLFSRISNEKKERRRQVFRLILLSL